ncbi:MAG: hypothetical protein KIT74_01365 [Fimbriimonadales bacterium]|nr:hypothetical protein [Fimbriimonadales bacterium]
MIVLVIIAVVAAILMPIISSAKRSAKVSTSIQKMRQLYAALEVYRLEHDGSDGTYDFYKLGLAPGRHFQDTLLGLRPSAWESPFPFDKTIFDSGPTTIPGWITYGPGFYDPMYLHGHTNIDYHTYLATYRQNAVVFIDPYCNPPGTHMRAPFVSKRALAILLSGEVVNRSRTGNAFLLHFYSDVPE